MAPRMTRVAVETAAGAPAAVVVAALVDREDARTPLPRDGREGEGDAAARDHEVVGGELDDDRTVGLGMLLRARNPRIDQSRGEARGAHRPHLIGEIGGDAEREDRKSTRMT